jgi:aminoglycoside 6'-N-acetyltransferase I
MRETEVAEVHAMKRALWPDFDGENDHHPVLVWERTGGTLGGFIEYSVRAHGDGCSTSPVPWVEGWWVAPELRRSGVGRALIAEVERWARAQGYAELGSDTWLDNADSIAAHESLGFEPTERVQFFRKRL